MAILPIVKLISDFVAAEKTIGGTPEWAEVGFRGEYRSLAPLLIDGRSTEVDLEVNAYPDIRDLRFRIMLRRRKCFTRVDYVQDEQHVNPRGLSDDIPRHLFSEPHIHGWRDNLQYCTRYDLPDRLPVARLLPASLRQFDATLRWFCSEHNIVQPRSGLIALPSRARLL